MARVVGRPDDHQLVGRHVHAFGVTVMFLRTAAVPDMIPCRDKPSTEAFAAK